MTTSVAGPPAGPAPGSSAGSPALADRLRTDVLVCDGAMGTMLHAAGNSLDQALPGLNLSNPDLVRAIHASYVEAGVDILQTNTFGAGPLRLAEYDLAAECRAINQAAVRIARAASAGTPVRVAGSVSPAVSAQQRPGVPVARRVEAIRAQVGALVDAGVDLVLLETFGYLDELVEAVDVALEVAGSGGSGVPVIAQATFGNDARTLSGHTPREVVDALADRPLAAIGTNCVLGPQRVLQMLRELRRHTDRPLTAQPNAGLPRRIAPARFEYDTDAEYFVRYARQLVEAGASVVGGCCGTTPSTIAAVVTAVREGRRQRPAGVATASPVAAPAAPPGPAERGRTVAVQIVAPPVNGLDEAVGVVEEIVRLGVDLVSVVPSYSHGARVGAVDVAVHLRQRLGLDTMAAVTTWDRTSMVLQADLLGAHALGLRRVVCETGSPLLRGDYPHRDGIWDLDAVGLIELLTNLNAGRDSYGLAVPARTDFEVGARINPGSHEPRAERARTLAKLDHGAQFLVTRPVYERAGLERLLEAIDGRVPVLATVLPLRSFDHADYLSHEVPDVIIPKSTMAALERAGTDHAQAGLELAAALAADVESIVDGLVFASYGTPVAFVRTFLDAIAAHR